MAAPTVRSSRRAAQAPQSYADPATDDEDDSETSIESEVEGNRCGLSGPRIGTRSRTACAQGAKTTQSAMSRRHSEFEDDDDDESLVRTSRPLTRSRRAVPASPTAQGAPSTRMQNHHEAPTDHESDTEILYEQTTKKRKSTRSAVSTPKRTKMSTHRSKRTPTKTTFQLPRGSGIIPAWQSLPYHILVQIFKYASYPVYDERTFHPTHSCRMLLDIARLCRAFSEPAISVLYSSPPLVPMEKAHKLVDLLNDDPTRLAFSYRQKVESLRIDVGQVAAYSLTGYGHLDLHKLVKNLPRLLDLELYHQKDMPPYRSLEQPIKWTYPDSLFEALETINPEIGSSTDPTHSNKSGVTHLRSWRWSSRLAGKKRPIDSLREIHQTAPFVTLRKISFVNYQMPELKKDEVDPEHENILAEAIRALPQLKHLILESSTLVNSAFLPLLPINLTSLELINCWEVRADDFGEFLQSHGSQLQYLTLNHNQSLSLSWLPFLAKACPQLKVLKADFNYFNLHATYHDASPIYEILLQPGEVPTWPSTLQFLEFKDLRKWEAEAASMFLQSLIGSAAQLPHLRYMLVHGGLLNLGWRDRAQFRDSWEKTLRRVFQKPKTACNEHYTMVDGFGDPRPTVTVTEDTPKFIDTASTDAPEICQRPTPTRLLRRSNRKPSITYAEDSSSEDEDAASKSSIPVISQREVNRKRRIEREVETLRATAGHIHARHDSLPSSPPSSPGTDTDDGQKRERFIVQGMCDVVDIKIDNQRPTELQHTEADFLDSEPEGDEDWNGDDTVPASGGYAW